MSELRPVQLPKSVPGRLWLSAMPGRFQNWNDFQRQARRHTLELVVCLTPLDEVAELSPSYHRLVSAGKTPFRWLSSPMPNFGVPEDKAGFRHDIAVVAQSLRDGESVLLHCAAGMGRTGSAAACVLKALGLDTQQALQSVRDAGSNPQNAQQSGLVDWF